MCQGVEQLHLRLLFILSSLFFKSSMLAVEEDVVTASEEWVWLESRSECWCCSLDSRSWESLLCSMSVEEATVGTAGLASTEVSGGRSSCYWEKRHSLSRLRGILEQYIPRPGRFAGPAHSDLLVTTLPDPCGYLCIVQTTSLSEDF